MALIIFLYLNFLDLLTTVLGIMLGGYEGNLFPAWVMRHSPTMLHGLVFIKGMALGAGVMAWRYFPCVVKMSNYGFALLIVWNLGAMIWSRL